MGLAAGRIVKVGVVSISAALASVTTLSFDLHMILMSKYADLLVYPVLKGELVAESCLQ